MPKKSKQKRGSKDNGPVNNYRFGEGVGYVLGEYVCDFIGSVLVQKPSGNDTTRGAMAKIKMMKKGMIKCLVIISPAGIAQINLRTKQVDKLTPIKEVSFVAMDEKNARIFSFISNNKELGINTCYNYRCGVIASQVAVDINDAFQISSGKIPHPPREGQRVRMTQEQAAEVSAAQEKKRNSIKKSGSTKSGGSTDSGGDGEFKICGNYEARFIASVPVQESKGEKNVLMAVEVAVAGGLRGLDMFVMISSEGIKFVNAISQEVEGNIFLKGITFTTVVNNLFAFIATNETNGRCVCHVFACGAEMALEMCKSVQTGFKIAQEYARENSNPFAVKKKDKSKRERASQLLQRHQIHRSDMKPIKAIGAGQFGQVWLGTMKTSADGESRKIAVKLMRSGCSADDKAEFVRECEMTLQLNHPNLVKMWGVAVQQKPWLCVLEFLAYGDLKGILEGLADKGIAASEFELNHCCHQITLGMAAMADLKMIHMDLALRNVLIHHKSQCKVADFGLTRIVDGADGCFKLEGSMKLPLKWMATESMDRRLFSEGSDVWSFGVTAWEIFAYGEMPYEGIKNMDLQIKIREGFRLEMPTGTPANMWSIIKRCFAHKRTDRPPFHVLAGDIKACMDRLTDKKVRDLGLLQKEGKKPAKIVRKKKKPAAADQEPYMAEASAKTKTLEAAVLKGPLGTFVVRTLKPNKYSITFNDYGKVTNFPVDKVKGKFVFSKKGFATLDAIVSVLKSSPFKGAKGQMTLAKPIPGLRGSGEGGGDSGGDWDFGTTDLKICRTSIRAGGNGDFLVRTAEDGDTAVIMVNDQGDVAEFVVKDIKKGKFIFAKRAHKSMEQIVDNLKAGAIPAKSGRKVKLLKAAKKTVEGKSKKGTQATPSKKGKGKGKAEEETFGGFEEGGGDVGESFGGFDDDDE